VKNLLNRAFFCQGRDYYSRREKEGKNFLGRDQGEEGETGKGLGVPYGICVYSRGNSALKRLESKKKICLGKKDRSQ